MGDLRDDGIWEAFKAILNYASDRVVDFVPPAKLESSMKDWMNREKNTSSIQTKELSEFCMRNSVNTSHPMFLNQLYGGVHPIGLLASYIIEKMNTNAHTYEVAPVFILAERIILNEIRRQFYGFENGDGIFAPGGSIANMFGMTLARHHAVPEAREEGLFGLPKLVVFTSQDAHYSITKAANWMGLGVKNVVKVATDKKGRMIISALQQAITNCRSEGSVPLMVNATSGTTVLGAFDDLASIAEICRIEKIWLHCDATWGGGFIFSPRLRNQCLKGIELCDSISWNAHKMLGAPLQCSVFITKHENALANCNSLVASYLFQQDKFYPVEYDRVGDKGIQCGRKADAFKIWFMWALIGVHGFQEAIENTEDCARYIAQQLKTREDFILYLEEHQCANIYFWYIPPKLQNKERTKEWWDQVGKVSTFIKEKMMLRGDIMVGYSPLPHKNVPNAIRLVLSAYPPKTHSQMDKIITSIVEIGNAF